ncbi:hypothetical protein ACP70R_046140 [Stipagrostis hirtigluma subsp. patula]
MLPLVTSFVYIIVFAETVSLQPWAMQGEQQMEHLPPGFRFFPTDEELITHYLARKAMDASFTTPAIRDVDLYKSEPWDLPSQQAAAGGERDLPEHCYFFCRRGSRCPSGVRARRATRLGYWKSTGKDKAVHSRAIGHLVGTKKTLVFYGGRAPRGQKTGWVMHEYKLGDRSSSALLGEAQSEWVICRVFMKHHHMSERNKLEMEEAVYDDQNYTSDPGHLLQVAPDSCNGGETAAPPPLLLSEPRHTDSHSGAHSMDGDEMDHRQSHSPNYCSSSPLPWLMHDDQLGAFCSPLQFMQQQPDDDPGYHLPELLEYDAYDDLPKPSGGSPDTDGEVGRRVEIFSASVGSIHLGELHWNFGF